MGPGFRHVPVRSGHSGWPFADRAGVSKYSWPSRARVTRTSSALSLCFLTVAGCGCSTQTGTKSGLASRASPVWFASPRARTGQPNGAWCRQPCEGSGGGAAAPCYGKSAAAPPPQLLERLQHKPSLGGPVEFKRARPSLPRRRTLASARGGLSRVVCLLSPLLRVVVASRHD